jgi:hypothetical protein
VIQLSAPPGTCVCTGTSESLPTLVLTDAQGLLNHSVKRRTRHAISDELMVNRTAQPEGSLSFL